jgi:putative endonuclease
MRPKELLRQHSKVVAVRFLETVGMRVLDRNGRRPDGGIDFVALDGAVIDDGGGAPQLEHLKGVG